MLSHACPAKQGGFFILLGQIQPRFACSGKAILCDFHDGKGYTLCIYFSPIGMLQIPCVRNITE